MATNRKNQGGASKTIMQSIRYHDDMDATTEAILAAKTETTEAAVDQSAAVTPADQQAQEPTPEPEAPVAEPPSAKRKKREVANSRRTFLLSSTTIKQIQLMKIQGFSDELYDELVAAGYTGASDKLTQNDIVMAAVTIFNKHINKK